MTKRWSVYAMAGVYIAAGVMHFARPQTYTRIIPAWVPDAQAAVLWSGVAEVVLGAGLLFRKTRYCSALGVIALLAAVFPANVQMTLDWWRVDHPAKWLAVLRLPLQSLLMWWAWKVRKG